MRTEISKLHRQLGTTMIYVTHDQVEAMTMGDRIVVLKDGYVQQIDTPLNLYDRPVNSFVAGFIGSPSMNFVSGTVLREDGLRFRAMGNTFTIELTDELASHLSDYEGKEVTLGIRPEDLYVAGSPYITTAVAEAPMLIDVIEPMGNEIVVYASTLDQEIVARVSPQPLPDPGQSLDMALDLTKLHFFDAETGEAIAQHETVPA
jgi:multiple sugar transport system ATP-binding protein